jgi:hypothetical protein
LQQRLPFPLRLSGLDHLFGAFGIYLSLERFLVKGAHSLFPFGNRSNVSPKKLFILLVISDSSRFLLKLAAYRPIERYTVLVIAVLYIGGGLGSLGKVVIDRVNEFRAQGLLLGLSLGLLLDLRA